jgi:predicted PurR-regulated permease PerM
MTHVTSCVAIVLRNSQNRLSRGVAAVTDQTHEPLHAPSEPPIHEVRISSKSIWQAIGAVLATILAIILLQRASGLVSMLGISFFFSLALQPAVNRLRAKRGWKRGSAVGFVYLLGGLFFVFLIWILIPAVAEIGSAIGAFGADWSANMNEWLSTTFGYTGLDSVDTADLANQVDASLAEWAANAFGTVLGLAASGIGLIFNVATIAMFTFYFTADAPRIQRAFLSLFNPDTQERIGWTWDEAVKQTGGYFYSRSILMFINGLGFFFTMVVVGMPTALAIGLAIFGAFVSVFIPAIGTYIGGAIPILVTLGIQGLTEALIVLGYVLVYQQVENYYLSPKISAHTMTLNGGVAFGSALAGGAIAGPMGAFMALPVAALITSVMSHYAATREVVYVSPYADDEPIPDSDE